MIPRKNIFQSSEETYADFFIIIFYEKFGDWS